MKNISIICLSLISISTLNLNAKSEIIDEITCFDVAENTVEAFRQENIKMHKIASYEEEFGVFAAAYDACMH